LNGTMTRLVLIAVGAALAGAHLLVDVDGARA
jgi:hypothetical protein